MPGLLIVGGLTVDRFADGSTAPGGSVLHAGLAAVDEGAHPTFVTVAGDEPEARSGMAQLAGMGTLVRQTSPATTAFRLVEVPDGRRTLVYEAASDPIDLGRVEGIAVHGVVLLAPIAGELDAVGVAALQQRLAPRLTVMLIQGWLRRLEVGEAVHPLPLDAVPDALWDAFGSAGAIVLSKEDLAEGPADPFALAATLRARVGSDPLIVLTLGPEGYLLDDPAADLLTAAVPRRVITGVPMVGAGDTFGAALTVRLAMGESPATAAEAATNAVIRLLERRQHAR